MKPDITKSGSSPPVSLQHLLNGLLGPPHVLRMRKLIIVGSPVAPQLRGWVSTVAVYLEPPQYHAHGPEPEQGLSV